MVSRHSAASWPLLTTRSSAWHVVHAASTIGLPAPSGSVTGAPPPRPRPWAFNMVAAVSDAQTTTALSNSVLDDIVSSGCAEDSSEQGKGGWGKGEALPPTPFASRVSGDA